jgi:hypothetical protein
MNKLYALCSAIVITGSIEAAQQWSYTASQEKPTYWIAIKNITSGGRYQRYGYSELQARGIPVGIDQKSSEPILDVIGTIDMVNTLREELHRQSSTPARSEIVFSDRDENDVNGTPLSMRQTVYAWLIHASVSARCGLLSAFGFTLKGLHGFVPAMDHSSKIPLLHVKIGKIIPHIFFKHGGSAIHNVAFAAAFGGLIGLAAWNLKAYLSKTKSSSLPKEH